MILSKRRNVSFSLSFFHAATPPRFCPSRCLRKVKAGVVAALFLSPGLLAAQTATPLAAPETSPAAVPITPVALAPEIAAPTTRRAGKGIAVNIDGHLAESDPAPLLSRGIVFVPLRGILELLGATVQFVPADQRIDIDQGRKRIVLRLGQSGAMVDSQVVALAPPKVVAGRAFVPLRALAELFGYRVAWIDGSRTVAIYTSEATKIIPADHRAALEAAGPFGVQIDFSESPPDDVGKLLDAAKNAGAGLVKTRFDWNTLEPQKGGDFQWPVYDRIVKEARDRGLVVVGILGDSTQWASVSTSLNAEEWRSSPPRENELPAWSNYVKRTIARYANDVHAWQVWENPAASNFRSVARTYRKLARLAVDAAREADPKSVVHAAEPGGVELDFINDLTRNGLTPLLDGINVYPVAGWQPGTTTPTESFLLPYATLQEQLKPTDGKTRDYWVGGLSYPTLEIAPPAKAETTPVAISTDVLAPPKASLLETFSPAAQADYLVRSMTLALASGTGKAFWSQLRDRQMVTRLQPLDPDAGTGLLRADNTPRPSYAAFRNLSRLVGKKPYAGNLALGSGLVALLFDDKKAGVLVVWSPSGDATLALSSAGADPKLPGALYVATRPDSLVLDATGAPAGLPDGPLKLSGRPIFITNVALETATLAGTRAGQKTLRLTAPAPSYAGVGEVKAIFDRSGGEAGLAWRKYADFGGSARTFSQRGDRWGLTTESQRNIFDLSSARPFIYLDVADDFLFFQKGVPVEITVEVHRPAPPVVESIFTTTAGFRVEYDAAGGFKSTPWQQVPPGEDWATFTFTLPDASFANAEGYDLLINAGGSKADLVFGGVTVKRLENAPVVGN